MNSTDKTNFTESVRGLSILHYAMTFGALAITLLFYFFNIENGHIDYTNTDDIFLYICPAAAILGVFVGGYMYRKKIEDIEDTGSLQAKFGAFREATIFKFALIEGPALICLVAASETENLLYMIITLILIAYLFTQRITEEKVKEELNMR